MRLRRRTLGSMDLQRILADVLDVIVEHDGDDDAIEAILRGRYSGDELAMALDTYAAALVWVYQEPGGPAFLRGMRDRWRAAEPEPAPSRRRRWRVA